MIAVLTAGGTIDAAFAEVIGTSIKALAPWRGMRLIDPAIIAARACGADRIIVIGGHYVKEYCADKVDEVIASVEDGQANLHKALQCARSDESLMLLSTDMPFITPKGLSSFLEEVGESEVAMALADGHAYEAHYPGASKQVITLKQEHVAHGNVFYFSSGIVAERSVDVAKRLFRARKNLVHLASILDIGLMLRFATKQLRISDLEAYAQRRFGLAARGIRHCAPGLCFDIDTLADYHYATAFHGAE